MSPHRASAHLLVGLFGAAQLAVAGAVSAAEPQMAIAEPETLSPAWESPAPAKLPAAEGDASRVPTEEDIRRFFHAIAVGDKRNLCEMLNSGFPPDSELPHPVPEDFLSLFESPRLKYYLSREKGFTPLMLAASLGDEVFVKILLAAGANPAAKTRRHKTFALWLAGSFGHLETMRLLMGIGPGHAARRLVLRVDLGNQHAFLFESGHLLESSPISSGKPSHPTPTGMFLVTDKYRTWTSTLYRAKMPFFLRLSCGDFGFHEGALPGRPASHGCIRLPGETAKSWFEKVPVGTLVVINE